MPVASGESANILLNSLQSLIHDLDGVGIKDTAHTQALKLQEFLHDGAKVQGLATTEAIKRGDEVYMEPLETTIAVPNEDMKLPGFTHLKDEYEKLGFWLAQAKHDFVDHAPENQQLPRSDWIVLDYIKSLPSLADLRNQGLPLAASYSDLHKLDDLPHLGALSKSVDKQRETLLDDWAAYTKARSNANLPKIGYADALWGLSIARSQGVTYPGVSKVQLVPLPSMLNSSHDGNVVIQANEIGKNLPLPTTQLAYLHAEKDIAPGSEILLINGNGDKTTRGLDLLAKHGFFDTAGVKDAWSIEECKKIQSALPHESLQSSKSKMLGAVDALVQHNCPSVETAAPAKAASMSENAKSDVGVDVTAKAPEVQSVNPLLALLSSQGAGYISRRPSRDSRYAHFL